LQATGDSAASLATNAAVNNMIKNLGIDAGTAIQANGSMAGVVVTAELPPFARSGEKIDLKVSAIGDAKSLAGGTLLLSPLKSGDGQVYAFGQGAVVVGQADGNGAKVLTVAHVPSGGVIEREVTSSFLLENTFKLALKFPDFANATRISEAINTELSGFFAKASDPGSVDVTIPPLYVDKPVEFVARIQALEVEMDSQAIVAIDERTGTIVMGESVTIRPVTISHGNLTVKVEDRKMPATDKMAKTNSLVDLKGSTVGDIVKSLNSLGAKPSDVIGIMKALNASGALHAELKFL
jgi:flagellar P-ring protein precursor FlgI